MLIIERVNQFLKHYALLAPGDTLLVGVSGGADSLCLLHTLATLQAQVGFVLHVAHFDHTLRGGASTADAAFVVQTAEALGLPVTVEQADVAAAAQDTNTNLHHMARVLRYRFFVRLAQALGAQAIAVAHTADDQAETVLMHLLRGAGTTGLRGILPISDGSVWISDDPEAVATSHVQHPTLLRPLLTTTRGEIETYCAAHGLVWREDATNRDTHYTRNHIRHELLPAIRTSYPHIGAALNRTAAICADDADFIEQSLAALWPTLARTAQGTVTLDGTTWHTLHPALQRAALRRGYALLAHGETLPWERIEAARTLIGTPGKQIELPGSVRVVTYRDGAILYGPGQSEQAEQLHVPQLVANVSALAVPTCIMLEKGWQLHAAVCKTPVPTASHRWEVYLDAAVVPKPLSVRHRRPGDRLRPAGGRGSRRMQDVFVDAKIPRGARERWPLVTTSDAIVWVPGVRAAEGFTATATTERAIHIWMTQPLVESSNAVT